MPQFDLPETVGLPFTVETAQVPLNQVLVFFRLFKLLICLLHFLFHAFHLIKLLIRHPVFPFLVAGLLPLERIYPFGTFHKQAAFILRQCLNLFNILKMRGDHLIFMLEIFYLSGCLCNLLQAPPHIFLTLLPVMNL